MIYAILQMLLLVTGHIFVKYGFASHHPAHTLMLMFICALCITGLITLFHKPILEKARALKSVKGTVIIILFLCFFNAVSFYTALYFIGLSGIAVLGRLSVVLMILSGLFFFKEKLHFKQIIFIATVFCAGLLFALSGSDLHLNLIGTIMCFCASLSWVAMNVIIKKHSDKITGRGLLVIRVPFMFTAFSLSYFLGVGMNWFPPMELSFTWQEIALAMGAALCLPILPYLIFPLALKETDLSTISVINSMQPIIGFFAGIVLFSESVDPLKLVAASISITAGILYSLIIYKEKHAASHLARIRGLRSRLQQLCRL